MHAQKLMGLLFNNMNFFPVSNKSQSAVIASVLLILIVMVSAVIIMSFVVPFVRNQLSGADCLDVSGKMQITNNLQYTCYNVSSGKMHLQVHYEDLENITKGFQITIESGGSSSSHSIIDGETTTNITMLDGIAILEQPGKNEERTYDISVSSKPESISIYPVLLNKKTCDLSDSLISVNNCVVF